MTLSAASETRPRRKQRTVRQAGAGGSSSLRDGSDVREGRTRGGIQVAGAAPPRRLSRRTSGSSFHASARPSGHGRSPHRHPCRGRLRLRLRLTPEPTPAPLLTSSNAIPESCIVTLDRTASPARVAAAIGVKAKFTYRTTLNGFDAKLTEKQLQVARQTAGCAVRGTGRAGDRPAGTRERRCDQGALELLGTGPDRPELPAARQRVQPPTPTPTPTARA